MPPHVPEHHHDHEPPRFDHQPYPTLIWLILMVLIGIALVIYLDV